MQRENKKDTGKRSNQSRWNNLHSAYLCVDSASVLIPDKGLELGRQD